MFGMSYEPDLRQDIFVKHHVTGLTCLLPFQVTGSRSQSQGQQ